MVNNFPNRKGGNFTDLLKQLVTILQTKSREIGQDSQTYRLEDGRDVIELVKTNYNSMDYLSFRIRKKNYPSEKQCLS